MRSSRSARRPALGWTAALLAVVGCASSGDIPGEDHYLRRVAFEVPINEDVLLRWPVRRMPLRVHLPPPPEGLFEDAEAIHESVRSGVLDWADAAGPGLPRFVFVEDVGQADVPIVWAEEPDGDWYIAHCAYDIQPLTRRFGVSRILVTARWGDGDVASPGDVYLTVLHEMGHALGLGGHSTDPGDVMYPSISASTAAGLSARDRATLRMLYTRPIGTRIVGARGD